MKCPSCKTSILNNENYCPNCGKKLLKINKKLLFIILLVFILLLFSALIILVINNQNKCEKTQITTVTTKKASVYYPYYNYGIKYLIPEKISAYKTDNNENIINDETDKWIIEFKIINISYDKVLENKDNINTKLNILGITKYEEKQINDNKYLLFYGSSMIAFFTTFNDSEVYYGVNKYYSTDVDYKYLEVFDKIISSASEAKNVVSSLPIEIPNIIE